MEFIKLNDQQKDITGQRFGRLVAIGPEKMVLYACGQRLIFWRCKCDCGNEKTVALGKLSNGNTSSCGCFQREHRHGNTHGVKHAMTHSPEYRAWRSMKKRCTVASMKNYSLYGGRGISVCERWMESFENFFADMGQRPSSVHSLDRKDNNGNYNKQNCRWATLSEQGRNRRTNRVVNAFGKILPLVCFFEDEGPNSRQYERARQLLNTGMAPELAILAGRLD